MSYLYLLFFADVIELVLEIFQRVESFALHEVEKMEQFL